MLVLLLTLVCGQASAASKPKFVVSAPTTAPLAYGKVPVRASLKSNKSAKVRVARFYVNGKLVTTDRRTPFKIKGGVKFDTRKLSKSKPYVTLLVKYEQIKKNGKIAKKSLKKRIRVSFIGSGNVNAKGTPLAPPFGYPLAYSEEFNGNSLDTSIWNDQRYDSLDEGTPGTPAMSRPYNYAEGASYNPNNVSVGDGELTLKLTDDQAPHPSGAGLPRSTGMVNSKNKFSFKYGYVETRAMVPGCNGCWPSFWIMPSTNDNWPPEIDIFEYFQFSVYSKPYPHTVFHWKPDGPEGDDQFEWHTSENDFVPSPKPQEWFVTHPSGKDVNYLNQWHTYGLLWTKDYAEIYVDGKFGARVTGASKLPQEPMYLIYMMAICRVDDDPTGDIINGVDTRQCTPETGASPAGPEMKIDYLRVFSHDT
jgi:hypothetical protein